MISLNSGDGLYASVGSRSNNRPAAKVRQDRATILDLLVEAAIISPKTSIRMRGEGTRGNTPLGVYLLGRCADYPRGIYFILILSIYIKSHSTVIYINNVYMVEVSCDGA